MTSPSDIIDRIHAAMLEVGIVCTALLIFDGLIHRFFVEGDKPNSRNGWYVGFQENNIATAVFGTWKDPGVSHKFCSRAESSLTPEENKAFHIQLSKARKKLAEEVVRRQAKCRNKAVYIWGKASTKDIDLNGYARRKKIIPYGAKTSDRGDLIVPMFDINGDMQSLQFISPDGEKIFLRDTPKKGHFSFVAETGMKLQDATVVVICEGYATACSVHQATGYPVVMAFDAGNLKSVAEEIRNKYHHLKIIIAADDDIETAGNPGIRLATEAARATGGLLAVPVFRDHAGNSDFNDMFVEQGSEAVLDRIETAVEAIDNDTEISSSKDADSNSEIAIETNQPDIEKRRFAFRPFPFEILPEPFYSLVQEYSRCLQIPAEFVAMCFMTVSSGSIGNSLVLEVKRGWEIPPFLWLAVIAESGSGKSHGGEAAMVPVKELQAEEDIRFRNEMEEYDRDLAAYKMNKMECEPPQKPAPLRHFYTTNFTIEALIPMYQACARGLIVHVDEFAGLVKGLNQYKGGGSDKEQLLSLFNATDIKSDRKSGCGYVRNSGAAVIGGIQPKILAQIFGQSDFDNGMVYRILPMAVETPPPRFNLDGISATATDSWRDFIRWTYEIPLKTDSQSGKVLPTKLTLRPDALEAWRLFHDGYAELEPFISPKFRGYLPKLRTYCLKFMAILHVMKCYQHDELATDVSLDTVNKSILLTEYFGGQALRLIQGASEDRNPYHAPLQKALVSLQAEVAGGKLLLSRIRERVNELLPSDMRLTESGGNKQIATWLRGMKLTITTGTANKSFLIWEPGKIIG